MMKVKEVRWARGSRWDVDPDVALAEMEKIRKKGGGDLTPDAVVAAAKSNRSPIHKEFEWDDSVAGHKFRCTQARTMIATLKVVYEEREDSEPVRHYNVVQGEAVENKPRKVYRTTEDIMSDPETRAELLSDALRQLRAFQVRFRGLQELAPVFRGIAEAMETI